MQGNIYSSITISFLFISEFQYRLTAVPYKILQRSQAGINQEPAVIYCSQIPLQSPIHGSIIYRWGSA